MILAKLKREIISLEGFDISLLPEVPKAIPCNVCIKEIAIQNVFRKHGDSGSWSPLDRDLFINKFMKEPKSTFLKIEEATGIISANPYLNQGFVKKEIFTNDKLKELGFTFNNDKLESKHSKKDAELIFQDLSAKVLGKIISTRNNRGKVIDVLEKSTRNIIEKNKKNPFKSLTVNAAIVPEPIVKKKSARTKKKNQHLFHGPLYLKKGQISDLYRDIDDLYAHYIENKDSFSQYFPSLIRMSLRLLSEAAANDVGISMPEYVKNNFKKVKASLDSDAKTTLYAENVNEANIVQHLHIGAHDYQAGNNINQTIAISLILGLILTDSHGK